PIPHIDYSSAAVQSGVITSVNQAAINCSETPSAPVSTITLQGCTSLDPDVTVSVTLNFLLTFANAPVNSSDWKFIESPFVSFSSSESTNIPFSNQQYLYVPSDFKVLNPNAP